MTEYWVSKKQYFCKYCNIYIRDDAPSRKQHETGLKHIGAVERYIRDLYKGGAQAKRDKEAEAIEMARIEASAAAAYAQDTQSGAPASKLSVLQTIASSSSAAAAARRPGRDKPKDQFSNYSTAEQLGLIDPEDAAKEAEPEEVSYEIAQKLGGQAANIGKWEVVEKPSAAASTSQSGALGEKRTWTERDQDEEENEGWKFEYNKGKRAVHDPYEDDFDPSSLKLKVKKKEEKIEEIISQDGVKKEDDEGALKREGWTGKLELNPASSERKRDGLVYVDGGWVKKEDGAASTSGSIGETSGKAGEQAEDVKPDLRLTENGSADAKMPASEAKTDSSVASESNAASSMFKKRRPPPSSRKK